MQYLTNTFCIPSFYILLTHFAFCRSTSYQHTLHYDILQFTDTFLHFVVLHLTNTFCILFCVLLQDIANCCSACHQHIVHSVVLRLASKRCVIQSLLECTAVVHYLSDACGSGQPSTALLALYTRALIGPSYFVSFRKSV